MKRHSAPALLLLLGCLIVAPAGFAQQRPDLLTTQALPKGHAENVLSATDIAFGVYDPRAAFESDRAVDIEHIFVFWQALDFGSFRETLAYIEQRNRMLMITIEPYTRAENWRDGGDQLFAEILSGKFDREIGAICSELNTFQGEVLVRWGHDMEDPTGRYPWARADNEGYKAAYRYFASECRRHLPKAALVWSPKGEHNLADYYPGDEYVDYIGLSVWGLQTYDINYHGAARYFVETFREKYERVAAFPKPVVITELGVAGDDAYRERWFATLFAEISGASSFQKLRAVVYFNDKEPWYWPLGLGSPDWRIASGWFSTAQQAAAQRPPLTR